MVDDAAAEFRGVGDAHAQRFQPFAVRGAGADDAAGEAARDGERPVVGGADDGDLLRVRSEPLQAAGGAPA